MTFIFYDTETTGLKPAFDQVLQFAAIVTDDAFNVLDEINLRCRLQPHVLASPGAMFVTKVGPKAIQSAPLSCYQMVCAIRTFIEKWSPAVLVGFNNISFDENMLRQAFYQHLHPVYLTSTNGNSRMDVLILAHAVAAHKPEAIAIPVNDKGKPSFRLSGLIAANGLVLDNAHDALADTRATLALAAFLKDRAPEVWNSLFACRSKALTSQVLAKQEIVLFTDRMFRNPTILAGLICTSPNNPAYYAMFDLAYDPSLYLDVDLNRAKALLKSNPRPIRILKSNNLPIVHPLDQGRNLGVDLVTAKERLGQIRAHPTFASTIANALASQYDDSEPSPYIEEHIHAGFPSRADTALMEGFHRVPWAERYSLAQSFADARYREFAERLIFVECPDALPAERKRALETWNLERSSTTGDVPWMTRDKAWRELQELKAGAAEVDQELLQEIEFTLSASGV